MKAELRAAWAAALRSGEYEQGQGLLRYTDGHNNCEFHCCLGVLCDITPGVEWKQGSGPTSGDSPELAGLNDGGRSFSDIADYIEKNVPVDG